MRYRQSKLIAGVVAGVAFGVPSYFLIDHFGQQLHLGIQETWMKAIEATGVGLWAGLSTIGIAAEVRLPIRQNSHLRRTGPLT